jgi:hypothetical protein
VGMDEIAWVFSLVTEPQTAAWQAAGARARRDRGKRTEILEAHRALSGSCEPREIASKVANRCGVKPDYVRRIIKNVQK